MPRGHPNAYSQAWRGAQPQPDILPKQNSREPAHSGCPAGAPSLAGLSASLTYPPGWLQRLARGVGFEVQILKVLPRFTMAKFKNRLTTKNPKSQRLKHPVATRATRWPQPGLERCPAAAGHPPQAGSQGPSQGGSRCSPGPLCPPHIPPRINAEDCAWSWVPGPGSETFFAIYYGKI